MASIGKDEAKRILRYNGFDHLAQQHKDIKDPKLRAVLEKAHLLLTIGKKEVGIYLDHSTTSKKKCLCNNCR